MFPKTNSGIPEGTRASMNGKTVTAEEGESIWSLLKRLRPEYVYVGKATPPVVSWDAQGAKQWQADLDGAYRQPRIVDWFWSLFGK